MPNGVTKERVEAHENIRQKRNSERVRPSEDNVLVGSHVTLIADKAGFERAFNAVGYGWNDAMVALLGQTVEVVAREGPGIFGLPESEVGSGQPVWFYPFSVIYSVEGKGEGNGEGKGNTVQEQQRYEWECFVHIEADRLYHEAEHLHEEARARARARAEYLRSLNPWRWTLMD